MKPNDQQSPGVAGNETSSAGRVLPAITVPKGGGAILGIGEKFAANHYVSSTQFYLADTINVPVLMTRSDEILLVRDPVPAPVRKPRRNRLCAPPNRKVATTGGRCEVAHCITPRSKASILAPCGAGR